MEGQVGAVQTRVEAIENVSAEKNIDFWDRDDFQTPKISVGYGQPNGISRNCRELTIVTFNRNRAGTGQIEFINYAERNSGYVSSCVHLGRKGLRDLRIHRMAEDNIKKGCWRMHALVVWPHQRTTFR